MGDYSIDTTQPVKVDELIASPDGDAVFYACPGCNKDVRIAPDYKGPRDIVHIICHVYPCSWYEDYRARSRASRI